MNLLGGGGVKSNLVLTNLLSLLKGNCPVPSGYLVQ